MYLHALPGSPQTRLSPVNPLPTVQCCCALNAAAKHCYSLLVEPQCTSTVPEFEGCFPNGLFVGRRVLDPCHHGSFSGFLLTVGE